jgi:putative ABC transport system permease protein
MYDLSHVSKSFVIAGKRRVDALKDVTIRFPDHGLVFIVGKSGAGKSTLLNLLGFFLKPDQGGFTYQGEKAASFSASKIRELRRESIAFCFQNDNLDPDLSVFDNILLAKAATMKAAEPKIHDLLILARSQRFREAKGL